MSGSGPRGSRPVLPAEVERVIHEVLEAAGLDWAEGREETERELRAHFEDGLAGGASPADVIARFGDPHEAGRRIGRTRRRAERRVRGGGAWWLSPGEWWAEARRAARRLGQSPAFMALVVLTLGLGVGANTAILTVLDGVLFEDLPYAEPDRLVRVYESRIEDPEALGFLRVPIFREYRRWEEVFESLATVYTYREIGADLADGDAPVRVTVLRVSAGYFETLGVPPARGRAFLEDESFGPGESGGSRDLVAPVAMISDRLWREHFGADPDIVGRTIHLDGAPFEVVGVVAPGFVTPFGPQGDIWIPQDLRMGGSNNFGNSYLSAVGRLRDGLTVEAAQERAEALSAAYGETEPEASYQYPRILPLQDDVVGATRARMLWILAGASLLVLLAACLNVANLLLARGLGQDRQLALRSALGSGRARLAAGILLENGMLAVAGGAIGVLFGWGGLRGLLLVAPEALPATVEPSLDGRAFGFALAVTAVALLVFGLVPALRLSRTAPAEVLRSGDRAVTVGRAARRLRDGLVVVQVAVALVLVAGSALLTRSFAALVDVPLGVDAEGVLTYEVHLPTARYLDGPTRHDFHERLHDRVRDLAGVEVVGAVSWLPVSGRYHEWGFAWDVETAEASMHARWNPTDVRIIAGDYFDAMGIELRRGRAPSEVDYEAEPVVWINATIVAEVFGDVDPVGRRVWLNGAARRVVGIVEDIPYGARGETSRKLYMPHAQYNDDRNWALIQVVKARGDLADLRERIRDEIARLDGQLVLYRPAPFTEVLATVRAQDRFATALMGAFAGLALLLSLLGTYGVVAGSVTSRTREIGIRMALGADARKIRGLVLRYASAITIPGVLLGLVGAWAASRWIEALLFGVDAGDPAAYLTAVLVFVGVALVSGWAPAERATRVDTVQTLTVE